MTAPTAVDTDGGEPRVGDSAWSVNHRAAATVCRHAVDVAQARLLLDMLGLIDGPTGREVLPDETRVLPLAALGGAVGQAADEPPVRRSGAQDEALPANVTTPPGLRVLPPIPAGPAKKRQAPAKKKARVGLQAELDELERTDPDVGAAAASYDRMVEKVTGRTLQPREPVETAPVTTSIAATVRLVPGVDGTDLIHERVVDGEVVASGPLPPAPAGRRRSGPKLKPIDHGTPQGYAAHYRRRELPVCDECKDAYNGSRGPQRQQEEQPPETAPAPDETRQVDATEPTASALPAVGLDDWFAQAGQSPHRAVRRAAAVAMGDLMALRMHMDDLARAERDAADTRRRTVPS